MHCVTNYNDPFSEDARLFNKFNNTYHGHSAYQQKQPEPYYIKQNKVYCIYQKIQVKKQPGNEREKQISYKCMIKQFLYPVYSIMVIDAGNMRTNKPCHIIKYN